ncbi:helix-turn-helix domain-containing protein [Nonomuraea basaltis]|uniref:helix-turn-helix domain-containing protein n=1 Tax=Nonomuraea basaltis TaxID=2495887 RepID=UPI00110C405D|nr:XRE family transcriptional regulator [Nonomuraea basaltis]TMR89439.1 helix-turn-helix transcriptional regulator [Nonomuraea basaltis]
MDHNELVARNVRRLRRERGFSIGELARRSGVSKQTLSKVEQGDGNPTVETLSALCKALDVALRQLLTEWGSAVYVQRLSDGQWREHDGRSERVLDQTYGSGYVHTLVMRLERGNRSAPVPGHSLGTLHHVYVISGKLRTGPVEEQVELSAGDFARFPGDVPHQHTCISDSVVAHVVTTIPQAHQFGAATK